MEVFLRAFFKYIFTVFIVLAAGAALYFWLMNGGTPEKLSAAADHDIVISDQAGILGDTDDLYAALNDFYHETGIVPAFYTVNNEDWQPYYEDLEAYAYDIYVNTFSDESHWLIVYSEPETPAAEFNDWYWEGMQGDDTDSILTAGKADDFSETLQQYLTARSKYTVEEAAAKAFEETAATIMKAEPLLDIQLPGIYLQNYVKRIAVYIAVVGLVPALLKAQRYKKPYKNSELREITDAVDGRPRIGRCEYCGCEYRMEVDLCCPQCGASLPGPYYR